jgi:hypothetical protein
MGVEFRQDGEPSNQWFVNTLNSDVSTVRNSAVYLGAFPAGAHSLTQVAIAAPACPYDVSNFVISVQRISS